MSILSPNSWIQALIKAGIVPAEMEQKALDAIAADEQQAEQWIEALAAKYQLSLMFDNGKAVFRLEIKEQKI